VKKSSSPRKKTILAVDDAPDTLEVLQRNLTSRGYRVFAALAAEEAIKVLHSTAIDLVITDLKMPGIGGLELVRHVRENFQDSEVMMITGYATIQGAVEAVKTGAEEYLTKPFTEEELFSAVERAFEKLRRRRIAESRTPMKQKVPHGIVGESKAMSAVFDFIPRAAATPVTVLITGESGTGKELVARAIHYSSERAPAAFVPVNCGGIPESLLESELFGHVKGAFTGATESRAGFFQTADGGTIFLDEISNTGLSMQAKLLRVLQDREVCMVGSRRPSRVDVRITAATNRDLLGLVKKGLFREDLYYRINVITIDMPSLRERGGDILLLINYFVTKFAQEVGKPRLRFSDKALEVLKNYNWPGNVRELENVIQRLMVMTDAAQIDVPDLPSLMRFSALREAGFDRTLAEVEAEYILNVLTLVDGNKTKAAAILGIDRKTLREKLKRIQNSTTS
jgi:two-component system response regulator HydG